MAELAKLFMSISDESAYGAGVNTIIPLYIIATESNKILDSETGEVASGTTFANELLVMTSQRDVINTFGVPSFTENNGTIIQGDELNEVGLLGLYDAMGSSSLSYAIRGDIDLNQLKGTDVEPTQAVNNGSRWLDLNSSTFGVYRCNGSESVIAINQWDYVKTEAVDKIEDADRKENSIIFVKDDNGGKFYECLEDEWYLIGSSQWKAKVGNDATFDFAPYNRMPSEKPQGSIWISTSNYNDGSKLVMKTYDSIIKNWVDGEVRMFTSYIEAEEYLGNALTEGSKFALCGNDAGEAVIMLKEYTKKEESSFIVTNPEEVTDETKEIKAETQLQGTYTFYVAGIEDGYICNCGAGTSAREVTVQFNKYMSNNGINSINASITDNKLNFESTDGLSMSIETDENFKNTSGIKSQSVQISWNDMEDIHISVDEPTNEPEDGTLWFDTEEKYDILVNSGSKWQGLSDAHTNAKLYVTSEMPTDATVFSLWIDSNTSDDLKIYRFEGSDGWKLLDNSDQTSPYGVLFADARYYDDKNIKLTFEIGEDGIVKGTVLNTSELDPDAPKATAYPKEMILVNTRFTGNLIKKYKSNAFPGKKASEVPGGKLPRWVNASGNALDGSALFGKKAQRKMVVEALNGAIKSCEELKSTDYDFFYACCPGYPEVDSALLNLNADKKDMFYIVSDTPKTLKPNARAITDWGTNANNADHGLDGRVLRSMYITRQYPPMGLTSNVNGSSVAIPTSIVKMNNLLNLPTGQICAGVQNGIVTNVTSVGYITDENEYATVSLNDGLGEAVTAQSMNPILSRRNTGLLLWGENTENNGNTSLSDEHAILTLLRLKRELDIACTPFFFRKNTKSTRDDFDYVLRTILSAYVTNDELYDFVLDTQTPNTSETISRKELHANIAVEIVKGIEFIYIPIRVVNTGTLSQ